MIRVVSISYSTAHAVRIASQVASALDSWLWTSVALFAVYVILPPVYVALPLGKCCGCVCAICDHDDMKASTMTFDYSGV